MCTVCTRVHCIGDHLNALHAFDHLNEYPMASSNTEPISYGNHDADPEEEVDDIFKCRSKAPTVNVDMSDKSLLVKRRRQFYYNHVHSICLQILSKKTATERKSNSTCKPTLLMVIDYFNLSIFNEVLANGKVHGSAVILIVLSGICVGPTSKFYLICLVESLNVFMQKHLKKM